MSQILPIVAAFFNLSKIDEEATSTAALLCSLENTRLLIIPFPACGFTRTKNCLTSLFYSRTQIKK
jgi:hypothetical protein